MNQTISFALSGKAIPLSNLEVSLSMKLPDKDQSGQASSTASSEQGTKAKEIKVSGLVSFDDASLLAEIYSLAEATATDGSKRRYRVNHSLAQAVKFREAVFTGSVDATKEADLMAWKVSFTLKEYFSVAEKKALASITAAQTQTAQGTTSAEETPEALSGFERILQKIDKAIGGV